MQWTEKYAPGSIDEVIGNPSAVSEMRSWAKAWKPGSKPLLLAGPPGVGKTTAAVALARSMQWELFEMGSSDNRSKASVGKRAGLASVSLTVSGKMRMILFDEIDAMFAEDRGGASAVLGIIKDPMSPVVLTANDMYARPLASIRQHCIPIKFKRVHYQSVYTRLRHIAAAEGLEADDEALLELAKLQHGDMKAAINDLQSLSTGRRITQADVGMLGARDRKEDMFTAMSHLFKSTTFKDAKSSYERTGEDPEMFLNWVDENLPREYSDPEDLARAFEALSRADIYQARIMRRQAWGLMKYMLDMSTAGVALSKREPYHSFTPYQFPTFIRMLSASKAKRGIRSSISSKFGRICHTSGQEFISVYLPFLGAMFQDDEKAAGMSAQLGLDEAEIEYLKGCTAAKAKKIAEKASELRESSVSRRVEEASQSQKQLQHF